MKKLKPLLFTLISTSLLACHSPQSDTEKATKEYIKGKVNDPSSYEPIKFGKIDTVYTTFASSKECKDISKEIDYVNDGITARDSELDAQKAEDNMKDVTVPGYSTSADYLNSLKKRGELIKADSVDLAKEKGLTDKLAEKSRAFKKEMNGYMLVHSFRAKNGFGAVVLDSMKVTVDKNYKVVNTETFDK